MNLRETRLVRKTHNFTASDHYERIYRRLIIIIGFTTVGNRCEDDVGK